MHIIVYQIKDIDLSYYEGYMNLYVIVIDHFSSPYNVTTMPYHVDTLL